eukprot:m.201668 g.201668  ORF g.201668 m.201668 type:complete len:325 (-) comp10682_c0_seq6:101-1075(-)
MARSSRKELIEVGLGCIGQKIAVEAVRITEKDAGRCIVRVVRSKETQRYLLSHDCIIKHDHTLVVLVRVNIRVRRILAQDARKQLRGEAVVGRHVRARHDEAKAQPLLGRQNVLAPLVEDLECQVDLGAGCILHVLQQLHLVALEKRIQVGALDIALRLDLAEKLHAACSKKLAPLKLRAVGKALRVERVGRRTKLVEVLRNLVGRKGMLCGLRGVRMQEDKDPKVHVRDHLQVVVERRNRRRRVNAGAVAEQHKIIALKCNDRRGAKLGAAAVVDGVEHAVGCHQRIRVVVGHWDLAHPRISARCSLGTRHSSCRLRFKHRPL